MVIKVLCHWALPHALCIDFRLVIEGQLYTPGRSVCLKLVYFPDPRVDGAEIAVRICVIKVSFTFQVSWVYVFDYL